MFSKRIVLSINDCKRRFSSFFNVFLKFLNKYKTIEVSR